MNLVVSKKGIDLLISAEVSSEAYYDKFLTHPVWPGGQSGITWGIGYDGGQEPKQTIINDWHELLAINDLKLLLSCAGLKGIAAQQALATSGVKKVIVPFSAAQTVFYKKDLPKYAKETIKLYPGLEKLEPDAIAALISMIYNRGASITGKGREEMASIVHLVAVQDYNGISALIRHSERLWQGKKGMEGIVARREKEAKFVANAVHQYAQDELLIIPV